MRVVLVTSRSFGQVVPVGKELLISSGFKLRRISPTPGSPLSPKDLAAVVRREDPYAIVCGAEPITGDVLAASKKLRLVVKHGIGVDNIDLDAATSLDIVVAYTPDTNTEAVADLTIGLMLVLLRGICRANSSTRQGGWDRYVGHELGAITVGLIGTGKIGSAVARRLSPFGTNIVGYDLAPNATLTSKYGLRYVSLDELLSTADIVSLHVPLTKETRGMIGAKELSLMKSSAYLVNTARGELVDEEALYEYLKSHRIAGAALDVFSKEPPRGNPLLQLDNVIVTPHIGAYTYEAMERMDRVAAETIVAFAQGKRLNNVVTTQLGGI